MYLSKSTTFQPSTTLRMPLLIKIAAFCILAFGFASSHSDSDDFSNSKDLLFKADYKGRHTGIGIKISKSLIQIDENRFVLKSHAKSFVGHIEEESHFLVSGSQLIPVFYQYNRKIFGRTSNQGITFDWKEKTASFTRSDKPQRNKVYAIEAGTLDPSLYQLKLQQQLFHKEQALSYRFAKDSGIREMDFAITGDTNYEMDSENYAALQVERINQKKDKFTSIIVIPELNYQIAQIDHTDEDGSTHTIKLHAYEADQEKLLAFYQRISEPPQQESDSL